MIRKSRPARCLPSSVEREHHRTRLYSQVVENADRLFGAFVSTISRTGSGLSISRSIIQAHGSCIRVEPNLTEGAAFHFTLPSNQEDSS